MSAPVLVGLDMGTTSAKAVVFTLRGEQVARGRAPVRWTTSPGRAEITAGELLGTARHALDAALARVDGDVVGLGVTSMGEAGVATDPGGTPLGPVIAWHDERDGDEVAELAEEIGADALGRVAGLPLRRQWTLTKVRWLRRHLDLPHAVRWSSVAELVVQGLGGEEASDYSLASRTGWLDLARGTWWDEALHFSGIGATHLPPLVHSGTHLGTANEVVGRLRGAVLTTAGHDHQAAALGAGAAGPRQVLDSSGTAEALVRTVPAGIDADDVRRLAAAGTTVGRHVLTGRWCLLAATEGGLALGRLLRLLGVDRTGRARLDRLAAVAGGPGELRVSGAGEPSLTVSGIGNDASPGALWAAATDTVTADAARLLAQLNAVVGPHDRLVVTGGWAHSSTLMDAKRRHLGPLERFDQEEPGARGAALLAGAAAGVLDTVDGAPQWQRGQ